MRARPPAGIYRHLHAGTHDQAALTFACQPNVNELNLENTGNKIVYGKNEFTPLLVLTGSMGTEPASIDEALTSPDAEAWNTALEYEINQLQKLCTEIVDKPKDKPIIPCSAILREKQDANDNVGTRCVQIIVDGHKQMYGVDYTEMFSSAAKMSLIQVIFAVAAHFDWELHHIDIKSAYLNASLKEEVYMSAPCGVLRPGEEGKVCKLKKALYGLKQAGHESYKTLANAFFEMGFM
jgi:hypothetical protein